MEDYNRRGAAKDQLVPVLLSWGLLCIPGESDSLLGLFQYFLLAENSKNHRLIHCFQDIQWAPDNDESVSISRF